MTVSAATPLSSIAATASKPPGPSSIPSLTSGVQPRAPPCRNIPREVGARVSPIFCSNVKVDSGTTHRCYNWLFKSIQKIRGRGNLILAGDVGGTKCNLALFSEKGGNLTLVFRQRFASKEFAQFERIVKEFSRQAADHLGKESIVAAGFGIAGPVINGRVRATNLPWIVETANLVAVLSVPHVVLLNDLGAWGHSLEHLPPEDFCVLNPGTPEPGGTRALLAAGTGLGESILAWDGGRYRVVHSEGGHSDFAPQITRRGLDKSCRVCSDTLDLWTAIYGAEAGNLALKVLALGGVYVAGGIAVKIIEKIKDGTFFRAFRDKWHFEHLLENIPVSVVLNEGAPLMGAAYEALAAMQKQEAWNAR